MAVVPFGGHMTGSSISLVGQSCRSALNFWAAQQRRPTEDMKIFVPHPLRKTLKKTIDSGEENPY